MSNQNPFADPSLISFTELQQKIWANDELSYPRRREIASAINTVAVKICFWVIARSASGPAESSALNAPCPHLCAVEMLG